MGNNNITDKCPKCDKTDQVYNGPDSLKCARCNTSFIPSKKSPSPETINLESGVEIQCPMCDTPVAVYFAGKWGPHAMGHHEVKKYISKTQYLLVECPAGGQEIKTEEDKCPSGCDHKYTSGCTLSNYEEME